MASQEDGVFTQDAAFAYTILAEDGGVVVTLEGELDLATASELRSCLVRDEILNAPKVTLDLSNVGFLGSTCIGVIVTACKRVRHSGGSFTVLGARDRIRRVLEVSGLLEFLEMDASE